MKATLLLTHACNLSCAYCYVGKRSALMTDATVARVLDFVAHLKPSGETLHLGLFGGEPLLEFSRLPALVASVVEHPVAKDGVLFQLITNGTLLSEEVLDFILEEGISLGVSCDGLDEVQDLFRRFPDGTGSSSVVAPKLRAAAARIPDLMVNAVYRPETVARLPEGVRHFRSLGLRNIYLNPDYDAPWKAQDLPVMEIAYQEIASYYIERYLADDAVYISLIDNKITLMLNGGYAPCDRCSMGRGELAFTPEGRIYPCERLVGDGLSDDHCIGDLDSGIDLSKILGHRRTPDTCLGCSMRELCMNNCGCSNYFSSGDYGSPGPFLCASEKAAVGAALRAFTVLSDSLGPAFLERRANARHLRENVTGPV